MCGNTQLFCSYQEYSSKMNTKYWVPNKHGILWSRKYSLNYQLFRGETCYRQLIVFQAHLIANEHGNTTRYGHSFACGSCCLYSVNPSFSLLLFPRQVHTLIIEQERNTHTNPDYQFISKSSIARLFLLLYFF